MALGIAAEKVNQSKPGPRCGFGAILKALGPDDSAFFELMVTQGKTGTYIAEVFRADGHDVSEFTVRRHMKRSCSCR